MAIDESDAPYDLRTKAEVADAASRLVLKLVNGIVSVGAESTSTDLCCVFFHGDFFWCVSVSTVRMSVPGCVEICDLLRRCGLMTARAAVARDAVSFLQLEMSVQYGMSPTTKFVEMPSPELASSRSMPR